MIKNCLSATLLIEECCINWTAFQVLTNIMGQGVCTIELQGYYFFTVKATNEGVLYQKHIDSKKRRKLPFSNDNLSLI